MKCINRSQRHRLENRRSCTDRVARFDDRDLFNDSLRAF